MLSLVKGIILRRRQRPTRLLFRLVDDLPEDILKMIGKFIMETMHASISDWYSVAEVHHADGKRLTILKNGVLQFWTPESEVWVRFSGGKAKVFDAVNKLDLPDSIINRLTPTLLVIDGKSWFLPQSSILAWMTL
jgi:hypothetical protein